MLPILQNSIKSLISKLNKIHLSDYDPLVVAAVKKVSKFPEILPVHERFSEIVGIVSNLGETFHVSIIQYIDTSLNVYKSKSMIVCSYDFFFSWKYAIYVQNQ